MKSNRLEKCQVNGTISLRDIVLESFPRYNLVDTKSYGILYYGFSW